MRFETLTGNTVPCCEMKLLFTDKLKCQRATDHTKYFYKFVAGKHWRIGVGWFEKFNNSQAIIGVGSRSSDTNFAARQCFEPPLLVIRSLCIAMPNQATQVDATLITRQLRFTTLFLKRTLGSNRSHQYTNSNNSNYNCRKCIDLGADSEPDR